MGKHPSINNNNKQDLAGELEKLRFELEEARETLEAIRTGQIDALVVESGNGHQLYTLKNADQAYRIFIEKMNEGALTLNRQGLIMYCNGRFAEMVQLPISQVTGTFFEQFVAEDHRERYHALFQDCWEIDCKTELSLQAHLGDKVPVQLSLTVLPFDEGLSLSIIVTDLTAQKHAQQQLKKNNEQLEQANRSLEASNHDLQQFASVASHDLQEPLRKIQIFADLLRHSGDQLSPEFARYVNKIVEASGRMKTLIIDVLDYSKLSASSQQWEMIDLNELLRELQDDFQLAIQDKEARVTIGDLPAIEGNRGQIRQVFQNIFSNALKFTKGNQQPVIRIHAKRIAGKSFYSAARAEGPYCLITIEDNGIGFDEQYLNSIFDLFGRLNPKDSYEGSGIGLAIAKKILDKHQGLISASSREGQGSAFHLLLPIRQTPGNAAV